MKIQSIKQEYEKKLSLNYDEEESQVIFLEMAKQILKKEKSEILKMEVDNSEISESITKEFQDALDQLEKGKPLQYVIGNTNFYGYTFKVDENVLIPRPETEELVEWILEKNDENSELQILDVGTGSGVITITLALKLPNSKVTGVDISEAALKVAEENCQSLSAQVEWVEDDFLHFDLSKYPEQFHMIVSNPPYIRKDDYVQENVYEFEPNIALYVEDDPLVFYKKLIEFASVRLKNEGSVFVEINELLPEETLDLFQKYFKEAEIKKDLSGKYRMIFAKGLS